MAVDPRAFTNFCRTDAELEEMLLFSVMVANKPADLTARKLDALLRSVPHAPATPFGRVRYLLDAGVLHPTLQAVASGQYDRICRAFRDVIRLDPRACSLADLEACHGVGPKTARMFLLHSRRDARVAVLDTHILKFLRKVLRVRKVPKSTPPAGPTYDRLERAFLNYCAMTYRHPAEADLEIWKAYSAKGKK